MKEMGTVCLVAFVSTVMLLFQEVKKNPPKHLLSRYWISMTRRKKTRTKDTTPRKKTNPPIQKITSNQSILSYCLT